MLEAPLYQQVKQNASDSEQIALIAPFSPYRKSFSINH